MLLEISELRFSWFGWGWFFPVALMASWTRSGCIHWDGRLEFNSGRDCHHRCQMSHPIIRVKGLQLSSKDEFHHGSKGSGTTVKNINICQLEPTYLSSAWDRMFSSFDFNNWWDGEMRIRNYGRMPSLAKWQSTAPKTIKSFINNILNMCRKPCSTTSPTQLDFQI